MKYLLATFAAATSLSLVSAAVDFQSVKTTTANAPNAIPGAYIVELDKPVDGLGRRTDKSAHETFYSSLDDCGAKWSLRHQYDSPGIFIGAAVNVESDRDLAEIAALPHVLNIWPVLVNPPPKPVVSKAVTSNPYKIDKFAPHVMTGVDKLHAEGLLGKGIRIAIIDSGVDYLHPALGGGFGPKFKFTHGHDFVGDNYNGENKAMPDDDPMDCAGHGTHVAGIIGAKTNSHGFTGVAPEAELAMYRVYGCTGGASDDIVMAAMTLAAKDKHDILTMSLGGATFGWTEGPLGVTASRIADKGVVVLAANGNDGKFGAFYPATPATGPNVIAVASVENTQLLVQKFQLNDGHAPMIYYSPDPLPVPANTPIKPVTLDKNVHRDACEPLPDSVGDLSEVVVIVREGDCPFDDKIKNIKARGAKYALFYAVNNPFYIETNGFPAAMISRADGEYLIDQFSHQDITLTFPQNQAPTILSNPVGGLTSDFSSYGPTWDLAFKPAIAAPGGNVLSTIPRAQGSYGIKSGTSMATPFAAGSAALLLQKYGKNAKNAKSMRGWLESTAKPVRVGKKATDTIQTLAQSGAGLIDVYKAVHGQTIVTPTVFALNDTAHHHTKHTITVKNTSKKSKKYTITHVPAGTMMSFDYQQLAYPHPVPLNDIHRPLVTFKQKTITVKAGKEGKFDLEILPPNRLDRQKFPVYSGFFKIATSDESVQVAYMGVAAKMKDLKIFDRTNQLFGTYSLPALRDGNGNLQTGTRTYSWADSADHPVVRLRRDAGTREQRIDLVRSDYKLSMSLAKYPALGQIGTSRSYIGRHAGVDGDPNAFEDISLTRPIFQNGTSIPPGNYRLLLRALKITGNPKTEADYDAWLSPIIDVEATP